MEILSNTKTAVSNSRSKTSSTNIPINNTNNTNMKLPKTKEETKRSPSKLLKSGHLATVRPNPCSNDSLVISKVEMVSSIGTREYMEDVIFCPKELINKRFYAAFVFDGHNGGRASQYLKVWFGKLLPQFLLNDLDASSLPNTITTIISKLGSEFKRQKKIDGSTITGVIIDTIENAIHVVNIGDSVTMLYGIQGKVIFVTRRDSTDNPQERQRLLDLGLDVEKDPNSMWRMCGLNMSKAFGNYHTGPLDDALNKSGRKAQVNTIHMPKGIQYLNVIIASDGLFDEIQAEHVAQVPILRKLKLEKLMKFVQDEGFKGDNFSAIKMQISRQKK